MYLQIRRRRLARLAALENNSPSNSISPPVTPISQSPLTGNIRTQSPLAFTTQPNDEKCDKEENGEDNGEQKFQGFQVPSKPIDMPSSSKAREYHRSAPQRSDSETSSIHMEVDEASGCADKTANTDIDSGIENMEVIIYTFYKNIQLK